MTATRQATTYEVVDLNEPSRAAKVRAARMLLRIMQGRRLALAEREEGEAA